MKKLPYLLVTLLIGIMIGCGSTNPLVDKAKTNIENQNPKAALEAAEQAIEQYPQNPLGYYYKGVALGDIAGTIENPEERQEYYTDMNEAFAKAEEVAENAEEVPGEIERISSIKNVIWQTEHNRAIKFVQDDSLKQTVETPMDYSVAHLKNATMIEPDSSLSWNVLSKVAGMNKNYEEAAKAKSQYLSIVADTSLKVQDFRELASYYYNLDKQEKVVETFENAQKLYPNNETVVTNLADAYNRVGEADKAINTVEQLVEQSPDNPKFRLVLATQIYQKALTVGDKASANSDKILELHQKLNKADGAEADEIKKKIADLEKENETLRAKAEKMTQKAENQLNKTVELDSENASAYNTLGIIYQNRAKALFDKRNRTTDNAKAAEYDEQGKEHLKTAMKHYKKATEIDPENKNYWRSLFSIYTALGMDEKAKDAMEKAGM